MQLEYENCHLFHMDKFLPQFLDFVSDHFDFDGNQIFVYGPQRQAFGLKDKHPVAWVKDSGSINNLITAMRRARRIFLHGLFINLYVDILYRYPDLLRKCFWIIWGGDLYRYRNKMTSPSQRVVEAKRREVISKMGFIVTEAGEFDLACSVYKSTAEHVSRMVYPSNCGFRPFIPTGSREDGRYNLLLGNSATIENQHFDAFSYLKPFSSHVNIYCPLSYGDMNYRNSVIEVGKTYFHANFFPMLEYLPLDSYNRFLERMDVGFFNHNRQQAMGNLTTLLGMGKTVYSPENLTHTKWLKSLGLVLLNPKDFSCSLIEADESKSNHQIINEIFSFDALRKELSELLTWRVF